MLKYFSIALATLGLFAETPSLDNISPDGSVSDRRLLNMVKQQEALIVRVQETADADGNVSADVER